MRSTGASAGQLRNASPRLEPPGELRHSTIDTGLRINQGAIACNHALYRHKPGSASLLCPHRTLTWKYRCDHPWIIPWVVEHPGLLPLHVTIAHWKRLKSLLQINAYSMPLHAAA